MVDDATALVDDQLEIVLAAEIDLVDQVGPIGKLDRIFLLLVEGKPGPLEEDVGGVPKLELLLAATPLVQLLQVGIGRGLTSRGRGAGPRLPENAAAARPPSLAIA